MNERKVVHLSDFFLYLLGFLILWEWLHPLEVISDIGNSYIFVVFVIMMIILDYFSVKIVWKSFVVAFYIFIASYIVFYGSLPMASIEWPLQFAGDILSSMINVVAMEWSDVTNSFRTLLFFILLWMMTYLLRYWLMVQKRIWLFVFLSIVFVAVMDTFTKYDGDGAVMRLFILGMLLAGMLTVRRLIEDEKIPFTLHDYSNWLLPLVLLLGIVVSIGYLAPKPAAQWSDPVPFIISTSEKFTGGDSSVNKVGYDEDDTRLGGDFIPDDKIVFTTKSDSGHYWFIESKTVYTGLGWEAFGSTEELRLPNGVPLPSTLFLGEVEKSDVQVDFVTVLQKEKHIPYPKPAYFGYIQPSDISQELSYDYQTDKLTVSSDALSDRVGSYDATYQTPIYHIDDLRAASSDEWAFRDLQLPQNLPSRIRDLAESITEDETNVYDKAKAIESYFNSSEFTYAREDVSYPGEGEDFVDQFLFESKRGYCDHFSTSMVVMLRSVDIPARWVKGYTAGTYMGMEDGKRLYEVTNNNAHSWVEVYLDGLGWIPFEPTKGYDIDLEIEYNLSMTVPENEQTPETPKPESQPLEEQQPLEQEEGKTDQAVFGQNIGKQIKENFAGNWKTYLVTVGALAAAVVLLFLTRGKWLPYMWIWRFKRTKDSDAFLKAYGALLKELHRYGMKRQPEQTLREYASRVDEHFSSAEMQELTSYYEKIIYGNGNASAIWIEVKSQWEIMMKKTIT